MSNFDQLDWRFTLSLLHGIIKFPASHDKDARTLAVVVANSFTDIVLEGTVAILVASQTAYGTALREGDGAIGKTNHHRMLRTIFVGHRVALVADYLAFRIHLSTIGKDSLLQAMVGIPGYLDAVGREIALVDRLGDGVHELHGDGGFRPVALLLGTIEHLAP